MSDPIEITQETVLSLQEVPPDTTGDDLEMDILAAEDIVNDELEPHSTDDERLKRVGALIAAAFFLGEGTVSQASQGNKQISFTDGGNLGPWRKAKILDPTGRLGDLEDSGGFWSETL